LLVVCEGNHADPGTLVVLDAHAPFAVQQTVPLGIYPDDIAVLQVPK
jgi:hypothetical protein